MKVQCKFLIMCVLLLVVSNRIKSNTAVGDSPSLFQVTTAETRPGEAVLMRGEYLDGVESVSVYRLPDDNVDNGLPNYVPLPKADHLMDRNGTDRKFSTFPAGDGEVCELLLQNNQSARFVVPQRFDEGVFRVELIGSFKQKTQFYLNAPIVNWIISEEGHKATMGDYLRIQGKNLYRKNAKEKGQVVLVPLDGQNPIRAQVQKAFDEYSVSVDIPDNIPIGEYHLYFHNGFGGKTAWSEPLKIEVVQKSGDWWGTKVFNVQEYGAKGDGEHNETAAFRAALHASETNGGGTVYVPSGRYMLTGELILPPNTLLKGESKELTQIFWNALNWDTNELPNSLISGTHHFALKDLNLFASRAWGVIFSTGPAEEQGNIILENLILRQSAQFSGMVYQVKSNRDIVDAEFHSRWSKTGIILRGENIKVRDCDFNTAGMYTFFAVSGFIQNCRFTRYTTGVNQPYMLVHPKGLIFEDCFKQADGYGYAASIDESRNMYEARNIVPFNYTNDREAMTLDGGSGAYSGKIRSIQGTTLQIPSDAVTNQWTENKWIGGGVYIIDGKGAGQFRRIVSHTAYTIALDEPFMVDPDASSIISITTIRQNLHYINNEVTDIGGYQFYGSAQNCVISGLKMRRCNGIISRGSMIYNGKQPNWYIDIVNCELTEGNYSHWFGTNDRGHSGNQSINLIGSGGAGLNIGVLLRRNELSDFSYIRTSPGADSNAITDLIIEGNSFNTAKTAILLGGTAFQNSNVFIHNNDYVDVDERVSAKNLNPEAYLIMGE